MEKCVCSLELAGKLKELGAKQNSQWYWFRNIDLRYYIEQPKNIRRFNKKFSYSAFTVGELLEMLPPCKTILFRDDVGCYVSYNDHKKDIEKEIGDKLLQNAMAKMLIHLLENKLIREG